MRTTVSLALVMVCGCAQSTATTPGPLGAVTLQRPPGSPAVPVDGTDLRFEATLDTCAGPPFRPARVRVSWTAVTREAQSWIRGVDVVLLEAPDGLVVELHRAVDVGGAALEAGAPWIDVANLTLTCTRRQFRFPRQVEQTLKGLVQLKATGAWSADGSAWAQAAKAP
jgi:hypothetical protein